MIVQIVSLKSKLNRVKIRKTMQPCPYLDRGGIKLGVDFIPLHYQPIDRSDTKLVENVLLQWSKLAPWDRDSILRIIKFNDQFAVYESSTHNLRELDPNECQDSLDFLIHDGKALAQIWSRET